LLGALHDALWSQADYFNFVSIELSTVLRFALRFS
jgi:hypothetical protein